MLYLTIPIERVTAKRMLPVLWLLMPVLVEELLKHEGHVMLAIAINLNSLSPWQLSSYGCMKVLSEWIGMYSINKPVWLGIVIAKLF